MTTTTGDKSSPRFGTAARLLCHFHDLLTNFAFMLASMAMLTILAGYLTEVVMRYFLRSPTSWSNELVAYMLCVGTFLALPKVTRNRTHVAVTTLVEVLHPRRRRHLELVVAAAGVGFCGLATWLTAAENFRLFDGNVLTIAENPIPKWWVTANITIGLGLTSLYFLRQLVGIDATHQEASSIV